MDTIFTFPILAADAPAPAPAAPPAPAGAPAPGATAPAGGQAAGSGESPLGMLPLFAVIFAIFYFLVLRPQGKEKKKRAAQLSAAKKGDKIVTTAGIHGKIVSSDETTFLVEVDDGVRLRFDRAAIWQINREATPPSATTPEPEAAAKK